MTDYLTNDTDLTSVANAIRSKAGLSVTLEFPTDFVTAIANIPSGSTTTLQLGALRPDAERIKHYTYDRLVVQNEGVTLPAYSSSAKTIIASEQIERLTIDPANYSYFVTQRMLSIPIYTTFTKARYWEEWHYLATQYEFSHLPTYTIRSIYDSSVSANVQELNEATHTVSKSIMVYWSSETGITSSQSTGIGVYAINAGPMYSVSGNYMIIKNPALYMRGQSANPIPQACWEAISDIRFQYIIDVYRAPRNNLNYDGWTLEQLLQNGYDCIESNTHSLT